VVDFGCGIGRLTIPLAKMPFMEVVAVDASTHMLDGLAQRATAAGVPVGSLNLVHSHGPGLADITGREVDVVVARAVLIHHDYEGVETIVTALAETLREGGHFIADWPTGTPAERRSWIGVTYWHPHHRLAVARLAGLEPVDTAAEASVWRKA
jgi:2-polyprenyl-3-methyl-5-hydroxy-6-metoxy-1,4-benzoquinol methylase